MRLAYVDVCTAIYSVHMHVQNTLYTQIYLELLLEQDVAKANFVQGLYKCKWLTASHFHVNVLLGGTVHVRLYACMNVC
jgi:hypothetical protein